MDPKLVFVLSKLTEPMKDLEFGLPQSAGCIVSERGPETEKFVHMCEKKSLLVIHQGALGDVITSFPALGLLKKKFSRLVLACSHGIGRIALGFELADQIFDIESPLFLSIYSDTISDIDPQVRDFFRSYDFFVFFTFSSKLAQNIKILSQKPVYRISPRPNPGKKRPVYMHLIENLEMQGVLNRNVSEKTAKLLRDRRPPGYDIRKVYIQPGSGSSLKNWPIKNFIRLEKLLIEKGFYPAFILGPAEKALSQSLEQSKRVVQGADLAELVNLLVKGGAYIGNDSGVTHLAAWLGLPTLAIFGPTDPLRWKPAGRRVKIVVSKTACEPCFELKPKDCSSIECLVRISPVEVCSAFENLLKR